MFRPPVPRLPGFGSLQRVIKKKSCILFLSLTNLARGNTSHSPYKEIFFLPEEQELRTSHCSFFSPDPRAHLPAATAVHDSLQITGADSKSHLPLTRSITATDISLAHHFRSRACSSESHPSPCCRQPRPAQSRTTWLYLHPFNYSV